MKLDQPQSLEAIANLISCKFVGDALHQVTGINEIHQVENGDLVFVDHPKYYDKALNSAATTILINKEDVDCPEGKALIISDDPFRDFNFLTRHFRPFKNFDGPRGENFQCGEGTIIQAGVVIGNDVSIGKNCLIHPGVMIYDHTVIGDNVEIHSGTVLGADAFYYQKRNGKYEKMHSCGWVEIENDVEIGASCTIDKGVSGPTRIGEGSKLDNCVHVGHDTVVGKNCLFAAQVGIAGCVTIEDDVILWGQVGVKSDITIHQGAIVYAQSGVGNSLESNTKYFGSPADVARVRMKEMAMVKKLPEILEQLKLKKD